MKSGLCKYYQPLRLEKPSNFRLAFTVEPAAPSIQPTQIELAANIKPAQELGVTVSPGLKARSDEGIQ